MPCDKPRPVLRKHIRAGSTSKALNTPQGSEALLGDSSRRYIGRLYADVDGRMYAECFAREGN